MNTLGAYNQKLKTAHDYHHGDEYIIETDSHDNMEFGCILCSVVH
ncbi:hypothetical protein [Moraxella nasicaprae]|nr:hypothetical protein [Moraxella nasicaprae]